MAHLDVTWFIHMWHDSFIRDTACTHLQNTSARRGLQHTARQFKTVQVTARHCKTLQDAARHCTKTCEILAHDEGCRRNCHNFSKVSSTLKHLTFTHLSLKHLTFTHLTLKHEELGDFAEYLPVADAIDNPPRSEILQKSTCYPNTLQNTARLQHTATHMHPNKLQHIATHCNKSHHTATHCNTMQHTAETAIKDPLLVMSAASSCNTATHCNTLQHTATHRNTPQHTATHLQQLPLKICSWSW